MPTLNKNYSLTITPEQFLNACSPLELQELDLLLQSPRFQAKIKDTEEKPAKTLPPLVIDYNNPEL